MTLVLAFPLALSLVAVLRWRAALIRLRISRDEGRLLALRRPPL